MGPLRYSDLMMNISNVGQSQGTSFLVQVHVVKGLANFLSPSIGKGSNSVLIIKQVVLRHLCIEASRF